MSRWITLVLAGTSALALSTVATPTPTDLTTPASVTAGSKDGGTTGGKKIGGGWCC